jgi:uncharacterized damage-inducible protein DinB
LRDILPWLEYQWTFDFPVGMYRAVLARLAGAPARLEELLRNAPQERLARKPDGKWSALEHAGHLVVLEELHHGRVEQYLRGELQLAAADMSNRKTSEGNFSETSPEKILRDFRRVRGAMLRLLDPLTLADAARTAVHPRLKISMRLVDLCYFVAVHDDHHLAVIRERLK